MTSPNDDSPDRVDLHKPAGGQAEPAEQFDPYRFGAPEHPVPPEYAPPGYTPPAQFDPYRFGAPEHPVPPEYAPPGYTPPSYSPYGPGSPYGAAPQGPPPGRQPQQPGPWGPPGPPRYGQYPDLYGPPQPNHNHGKAVAALVLGIVSLVFCWLTLLDALLIVPAVVLAVIVLRDRRSSGRGLAIAGLVCAVVGAVAAVALLIWIAPIAKDCSDLSGDQQQTCIRDHL